MLHSINAVKTIDLLVYIGYVPFSSAWSTAYNNSDPVHGRKLGCGGLDLNSGVGQRTRR